MNSKILLITIFIIPISIKELYAISYPQLKDQLIENSKELQIKKYNIDIEKEELNIIDWNDTVYSSIDITNRQEVTNNSELMNLVSNAWKEIA